VVAQNGLTEMLAFFVILFGNIEIIRIFAPVKQT
jgi:hypothetical protein